MPFVAHLVRVLQAKFQQEELDEVMRSVGRGLASDCPRVHGDLPQRVTLQPACSRTSALNEVDRLDGGFVIEGEHRASATRGRT